MIENRSPETWQSKCVTREKVEGRRRKPWIQGRVGAASFEESKIPHPLETQRVWKNECPQGFQEDPALHTNGLRLSAYTALGP